MRRKLPPKLEGKTFGKLLVLKYAGRDHNNRHSFSCACWCGQYCESDVYSLRSGHKRSCGCLLNGRIKHFMKGHECYDMWCSMHRRCRNKNDSSYKHYGGRGISVCERWSDFRNFISDMGPRPDSHQIDREDNNGNYEPGNCRWTTCLTNQRNRSNNHRITANGQTKCVSECASEVGICGQAIRDRISRGWPDDKAATLPKGTQYFKPGRKPKAAK